MTDVSKDIPEREPVAVTSQETDSMEGGKRSAWMAHVKKTMRANKGKSLKDVLKMAGKTYKKSGTKTARKTRKGKKFMGMFGGMVAETAAEVGAAPMAGGRRRSRKGKKGSRKH